jgi:trimethylamine--corrinoid protein Co-methyltransferase
MRQTIEMSDKPLVGLSQDARIAADSIEMARWAAGDDNPHFVIGVVDALSPMAWDEKMLSALMVYAQKAQPCIVTACSMAGMSSHIRLAETLVQNHAEILAGIVLAQLLHPGTPVVYGNTSVIADMRTMIPAPGSPEFALMTVAAVQLARLLGLPCRAGGGLTDAKEVDAQAGIEAAVNLMVTEMIRPDLLLQGVGLLESFATISYDKWIMDEEIIDRICRITRGIGAPGGDAVDAIGQTGPGGNYLMHPSTLTGFRTEHFIPHVSDRSSYNRWEQAGTSFAAPGHRRVEAAPGSLPAPRAGSPGAGETRPLRGRTVRPRSVAPRRQGRASTRPGRTDRPGGMLK